MGDSLESSSTTRRLASPVRNLMLPDVNSTNTFKELHLDELKRQLSFQKVKIFAKVIEIGDTHTVEGGRRFQTVLLADHTGIAELALLEDFVGAVNDSNSYTFHCLTMKIFHDKPSLFTPRENTKIERNRRYAKCSVAKRFNQVYKGNSTCLDTCCIGFCHNSEMHCLP